MPAGPQRAASAQSSTYGWCFGVAEEHGSVDSGSPCIPVYFVVLATSACGTHMALCGHHQHQCRAGARTSSLLDSSSVAPGSKACASVLAPHPCKPAALHRQSTNLTSHLNPTKCEASPLLVQRAYKCKLGSLCCLCCQRGACMLAIPHAAWLAHTAQAPTHPRPRRFPLKPQHHHTMPS
jgi:hypothetical protein